MSNNKILADDLMDVARRQHQEPVAIRSGSVPRRDAALKASRTHGGSSGRFNLQMFIGSTGGYARLPASRAPGPVPCRRSPSAMMPSAWRPRWAPTATKVGEQHAPSSRWSLMSTAGAVGRNLVRDDDPRSRFHTHLMLKWTGTDACRGRTEEKSLTRIASAMMSSILTSPSRTP